MHLKGGLAGAGVYLEYLKCRAHGCMKSTWVHYTWRWGTGLPGAGSETGVYLEYLKLCLKLYRKLSIYLTHIPDLLFKFEMPRLNVAFNMPA